MPNSLVETISRNEQEQHAPEGQPEREIVSRHAHAAELSGLTVATVTSAAELHGLRADYEQLNREASLALPFTLHEWHCAWCEHFLATSSAIEDSLLVYVVRTATGRCVGIVPLIRTRRSVGPCSVSSLSLLGADQALTEIRMPLIAPGFHSEVARILDRQLALIDRWDWIQWMGATPAFGRGLAGSADLRWQQTLLDYVLDLPPDWDSFRKNLKRNIRESLRHCYNSLKRDKLEFSLAVRERPEDIQAGLDRFLRLHAMRAQMGGTITHPDHFATASAQAFLRDICAQLAARNITRLFELIVDGKVVATRIGFVLGDTLYLYYSGFDTAWSRYSVMTTALAEIIKFAIANGVRTINLSPGTDIGKTRWGPRVVPIAQLLQVGARFRSRAARAAYEFSSSESRTGWLARALVPSRRRWS
ncbi:MAG TPA: GNAT family N-acetyltransferase [Steroidobacteraceae bacterium]